MEKIMEPHPQQHHLTADEFMKNVRPQIVEFHVDGVGDVRLRGITKKERKDAISGARNVMTNEIDNDLFESLVIVAGLVEPKLTLANVREMEGGKAGVLNALVDKILKLSGFGKNSEDVAKNG